jgi:hypothetical protein
MKMYPDDWRVRLTTGVVVGACIAAAQMLGPVVGIHGFWPVCVAIIVGIVLGNLVGRLLFRPSSGGPPAQTPRHSTGFGGCRL